MEHDEPVMNFAFSNSEFYKVIDAFFVPPPFFFHGKNARMRALPVRRTPEPPKFPGKKIRSMHSRMKCETNSKRNYEAIIPAYASRDSRVIIMTQTAGKPLISFVCTAKLLGLRRV